MGHCCCVQKNVCWTIKYIYMFFRRWIMLSPEMAKPEKPTAKTRNEMATPFVWEKPTTSSRVASIPNPDAEKWSGTDKNKNEFNVLMENIKAQCKMLKRPLYFTLFSSPFSQKCCWLSSNIKLPQFWQLPTKWYVHCVLLHFTSLLISLCSSKIEDRGRASASMSHHFPNANVFSSPVY